MKRWYEISNNPHVFEVTSYRTKNLLAAKSEKLINNRIQYLCEMATGKSVLDIGVVDHYANSSKSDNWLHKHLCRVARTCLGVDIVEDEVNKLCLQGFNIICTDLTKEPLPRKFDLIVCGEVLEHLDAPGYLLANVAKMLNPRGKVVVTVPNPWYIGFIRKNIFRGEPFQDNVDHVCWFDPCTICELGERNGLILKRIAGIKHSEHNQDYKLIKKLFFSLSSLLISLGLKPELFAKTTIYEFVLEDETI